MLAFDFSAKAVQLVKARVQAEGKSERCTAFVADLAAEDGELALSETVADGTADVVLCCFVLSALPPSTVYTQGSLQYG